jgi:hypothetical protein
MVDIHLKRLIEIGNEDKGYLGSNSYSWTKYVLLENPFLQIDECLNTLNTRFDRTTLFDYCLDSQNDSLNVISAILSWGGMNRKHGKLLFEKEKFEILCSLVSDLRNNKFESRKSAFEAFQKKRQEGKLTGLGIGYFTKLICFLAPNLNGYIMDQWAGKSINLLLGEEIVVMYNGWVNDENNSTNYENFCSHIDTLASKLNCKGIDAEKRIFSVGGRNKGKWRSYLISNYNY